MDIRLGYDLTIEQTQKLVMTPELIQAIKILQFNTQELNTYIQEQLLINPVLEPETQNTGEGSEDQNPEETEQDQSTVQAQEPPADNDIDWKEYLRDRQYDDISYRQWEGRSPDEKENLYERYASSDVTLPEHLMFQLQFAADKKGCRNVGRYIIESLDENGYMTSSIEEISETLGVSQNKIREVLDIIHSFDPAGVGAQDLKECLLIQLEQRGKLDQTSEKVVKEHLEDIAANRLGQIAGSVGVSVKEVQHIADVIKSLEPKPGRQFANQSDTRYIIPDVLVERVEGDYVVTLNDSSTPALTVSPYYEKLLLEADKDSKLYKYLTGRLNSAMWLIKSIDQRKQTIYNVVSAVVKYQKDFFDQGDKFLKTLTLKQIAEEVGIHESTVSRSTNGKYLQSPRGVYEIKYFFSGGVSGNHGEGISSNSIKSFMKEMIDEEDPKAPYSDQSMVELLGQKGIEISRRTVAKYRDEMQILSSSKRKRY